MNLQEVHETTGKPLPAIKLALQDGILHGRQDHAGEWTLNPKCVDSWANNTKCSCRLIGETLRALRSRADLTIEQVAQETGLTIYFLQQIESGERSPTPYVAAKVSAAIAVELTKRNADAEHQ